MTGRTDKAYAYLLDDMKTEATRKAWERMREPEHPILFPQTLAELIGRLHGLADEKGYDANALSRKTGIPEARINAIFNDGTISIGRPMHCPKPWGTSSCDTRRELLEHETMDEGRRGPCRHLTLPPAFSITNGYFRR